LKSSDELSHFDRFVTIYKQFMEEKDKSPDSSDWSPGKNVSSNPTTRQLEPGEEFAQITAVFAKRLAQLFNQRYRLLMNYLAHSFRLAGAQHVDRPNLRAMLMHHVFGEMYNLKTLAGLLVQAPRAAVGDDKTDALNSYDGARKWAGPPFEMPYSLTLPHADVDVWRLHDDLIATSQETAKKLLDAASEPNDGAPESQDKTTNPREDWRKVRADLEAAGAEPYLRALMDLDRQARKWIGAIVAGAGSRGAARR